MERTQSKLIYTQPSESFWAVPEVLYRGEKGTYQLFDKMTSSMTQDKLAEVYETEKQKGNPSPTDAPLIWAISTRSHELRNEAPEVAESLRSFLQKGFRQYPNTLTRVIYNSSEQDKIIHNYKTSDEYSINEKVVGTDDWIKNISDKNVLEALLVTKDIAKINEVSQWINGTNSYLWRLNSKPKQKDERVARFLAYGSGLSLGCLRNPLNEYPAFRVLRVD